MAQVSKTKKTKEEIVEEKKECTSCGDNLSLTEYFSSFSEMNKYSQKCCICKKCVNEVFKDYLKKTLQNTRLAVFYTCRLLDYYYSENIFHTTYLNEGGVTDKLFGKYIRQIQGFPVFKGRTFADSDIVEEAMGTNNIVKRLATVEDEEMSFKVTGEMRMRWGKDGRGNDDYYFLEKQYNSLVSSIDVKDARQVMLLEEICNVRLEAEEARRAKRILDYEKLINMISKLMNDAGIKPKDDKAGIDEMVFGEWIRKVEEEEPIPEPAPEFKDVDGIKKYITKWFTKQFARIFNLAKDGDKDE